MELEGDQKLLADLPQKVDQNVICGKKTQPMDRKYWEKIAPSYNEEIFDVLHNDQRGLIRTAIQSHARKSGTVIDIGCAVGKWLPLLSPTFKKVTAVDISATNLVIAEATHRALPNVKYVRADMSKGKTTFRGFDMAVCINAILTDSLKKRQSFFENINRCLKKKGHLVLAVPSLESWLLTRIIQHQWQIDRALFAGKISDREGHQRYKQMMQGNVEIDNVATKHYLQDELQLLLDKAGFTILEIKKVYYSWATEFVNPPAWLDEPRPFDWMVVAKKN